MLVTVAAEARVREVAMYLSATPLRNDVVLRPLRDGLTVLIVRQSHTAVWATPVPVNCIAAYAHRAPGLKSVMFYSVESSPSGVV